MGIPESWAFPDYEYKHNETLNFILRFDPALAIINFKI